MGREHCRALRARRCPDGGLETAQNCLGKLMSDSGENYGLAVSRSLDGLHGPVGVSLHVSKSLEDNLFTSEVHENVVGIARTPNHGVAVCGTRVWWECRNLCSLFRGLGSRNR
jgi:hypothetical protein